jgi:hypothetical protein
MARCVNKDCRKKIEKGSSSFDNWCSNECKAVVIAQKFAKASAKRNSKPLKMKAQIKPKTQLKSKSTLKAKTGFKTYSTLKTTKPLKAKTQLKSHSTLKGAAIGSKQYKDEQKVRKAKAKTKSPELQPRTINGLDLTGAEAKAYRLCHLFIRTRDIGKPCFCCGRPLGDGYQAGHFQESGANSAIRYNPFNIHGQRSDCNLLHNGDYGQAETLLSQRIGSDKVDELLAIAAAGAPFKYTLEDYIGIIDYYTAELKTLSTFNLVA